MNCYSIRIHDANERLYDKYRSIHDQGDIFIVKELTSTNQTIHYQSYWKTDTKKDAITKRFQRLQIKGGGSNEQYAVTKVEDTPEDHQRVIQYLCKGASKDELPVVLYTNFLSDEQIKEYHTKYWLENETYRDNVKSKKDKIKELTVFQQALAYVQIYIGPATPCPIKVCELLIDFYTKKCKCEPNDFQLKTMTKSIISQILLKDHPQKYEVWKHKRAKDIIGSEFKYDI